MEKDKDITESKAFLSLLVPNQRRIQAFILMLEPNVTDAEDIYQETLSEMWNKFDTFAIGTDFVAWGITIAKYKVLTHRKKKYNSKMMFSSEVLDILEQEALPRISSMQNHIDVLKDCLGKLPEKDVDLLKLRYENDMTLQKISMSMGKSTPSIHRLMAAIHSKLALCIRRTLRLEEMA